MIYIVDDDPSVRTNLARLMRSAGFSARTFASAEEFLASTDTIEPDCLLVEVTLPGLSGPHLQSELNKRGIGLPVIALSARDSSEASDMARRLGARCFFRKPVDDQALIDAILWAASPEVGRASRAGNAGG